MTYRFTLKHRWKVNLHIMSGITILPWCSILIRHFRHIDFGWYWHRVLFLTFLSILNTLLASMDWLLYRKKIAAQPLHPSPLFILGHPRTGTTHLHNLLANDQYFAYASVFHVGFPSSFLCMERAKGLLSPLLEPTRPMDNMALHWDLPGEDEIATTVLSGGVSPYMAIVLPREEKSYFRKLYTFQNATAAEFSRWQGAFKWFMKKVTLRWGGCKPLLIKSPVHTARAKIWHEMFPQAKFVYIHRHPLQVFQSSAHMADTYFWYTYLQMPQDSHMEDYIIDQYKLLYETYLRDRKGIPKQQLFELSFEELEADPIGCMRRMYQHFGWEDRFSSVEAQFRSYCGQLEDFKKNHFNRLTPEMEEKVKREWGPSFETFGYDK